MYNSEGEDEDETGRNEEQCKEADKRLGVKLGHYMYETSLATVRTQNP